MIRRTSLVCLEVAIGIVVVAGALMIASAWRLSQGPVSLQFLMPYARDFLHDENSPIRVDVDDIVLTWAGWERALDVRAEGVSFRTAAGQRLARVREISVGLSVRALLQGLVAPTSLDVIRPRLLLVRRASGAIELDVADSPDDVPAGGAAANRNLLPLLIDGLSGTPRPGSRLRFLHSVRVIGGALRVQDEQLGITWGARYADLSLRRARGGLDASFDLELDLPEAPELHGQLHYAKDPGRVDADIAFARLNPKSLAGAVPGLAGLAAYAAPVGGSASLRFGTDGNLRDGEFVIEGGAGTAEVPGIADTPIAVRSLAVAGRLSRDPDQLRITRGRIELEHSSADFSGVVTRIDTSAAVSATAHVEKMPVDDLGKYWPADAADNARSWVVSNIRHGDLRDATANLTARISLEGADAGRVSVDSVNGRFSVAGATVDYLDPMPVLTDASATATFSMHRFDFAVHSGRVGQLRVSHGAVNIWDIGAPRENLSVSAEVSGSVSDALALVGHSRLRLLSRAGIEASGASGRQTTRLKVTLPLEDDLKDKDIEVQATSRLRGFALPNVLRGEGIADGNADLRVDNAGLRVAGDATYAGTPVRFVWKEDFSGDKPVRREVSASLSADAGIRRRFGVEFPDILKGSVPTRLIVRDNRSGERTLSIGVNLAPAALTVPGFNWTKPAGAEGTADVTAVFRDGRAVSVPSFDVRAGPLTLTGQIGFAADGETVDRAVVDRFVLGKTELSAHAGRRDDGTVDIKVQGAGLDARPFLSRIVEDGDGRSLPAFALEGAFDRVWINDGAPASDARITLVRDSRTWRHVRVNTVLPGTTKPSSFKMESNEKGDAMELYSADAGTFVQALGITDSVRGGEIEARAVRTGGLDSPWHGAAEMKRFRVAGAPTLARILTLSSLTGISDVVNGKEGIRFDRLTMPFKFRDGVATIADMKAVGSELGITASGTVDFIKDAIDIRGTIVPAYTINSLIGKIPVIGELLTGEKGGGLFAASYEVTGPVDNPKTAVNPLSTLAPGFLRKLLEGGGGAPAGGTAPTLPGSAGD